MLDEKEKQGTIAEMAPNDVDSSACTTNEVGKSPKKEKKEKRSKDSPLSPLKSPSSSKKKKSKSSDDLKSPLKDSPLSPLKSPSAKKKKSKSSDDLKSPTKLKSPKSVLSPVKSPSAKKKSSSSKKSKKHSGEDNDKQESNKGETKEEEKDNVVDDGLRPIPPPINPPMDKIMITFKQPNLKEIYMPRIDPANTNLRMIRDFLQKKYYRGHNIPRLDQRQLLYRCQPIFDMSDDFNDDDAKTLADHGIVKDCTITLAPMHVNVISPSTKDSMIINNVDPMNDVILEMRKLALQDGYPIEKLRVLHREANNKEITKSSDFMTFFDCGVKHNHTLELEWPKISLKVQIPLASKPEDDDVTGEHGVEIVEKNGHYFKIMDFLTQTELDKVQIVHDFIFEQTGISMKEQKLILSGQSTKKKKNDGKATSLSEPRKFIADYQAEENDTIELLPWQLKINFSVGPDDKKHTIFENVYPNDTIETIKDRIARGDGVGDGIPPLMKTITTMRRSDDRTEFQSDIETLLDAGINDGDELDVEKTKITIKMQLPKGVSGPPTECLEIGVDPKRDDIDTLKAIVSETTGVPKEFLPSILYYGESLYDGEGKSAKLKQYQVVDNDIFELQTISVIFSTPGGKSVCLDKIDPFHDSILDLKKRLGPDDMNIMPLNKQRFIFKDTFLDKEYDTNKLFECNIKDTDTLILEKSQIDLTILQPNKESLYLKNIDPRKDFLPAIHEFLSVNYFKGPLREDQLPSLIFDGKRLDPKDRSLFDNGIYDDGQVIEMQPMTIYVVIGSGDSEETRLLDDVDPVNDNIHHLKLMAHRDDISLDEWILFHKESDMKQIEDNEENNSFYDHGVKNGHTIYIQRKPIMFSVKLPKGCETSLKGSTSLFLAVDPDTSTLDTIREAIFDAISFPIDQQRLTKVLPDSSRKRIEASGETLLTSPDIDIVEDCVVELKAMTIEVNSGKGGPITLSVLPMDHLLSLKEKLSKKGVRIPSNKQRLIRESDGIELGGSGSNENCLGNDQSSLAELGVRNGDMFAVEKAKISLMIKMPYGKDDVEVVIDPKYDTVDRIRQLIYESTGLPMKYQQRYTFKGESLDDGYHPDTEASTKMCLGSFNLKEMDAIHLGATQVYLVKLPEKERHLIQSIDPMSETLLDLKKRAAGKTMISLSKQRLLHSETEEEYASGDNNNKTLYEYDIEDSQDILLEKNRLDCKIVLPSLKELELTVDPRYGNLDTIRNFISQEYYKNRDIPNEDLRPMLLRGAWRQSKDEPGSTRIMDLGIIKDDAYVKLKPCYITIHTPKRNIICPNADPFHDTLNIIINFVKHEGIDVAGMKIVFNGETMTDYDSVLYDLNIKQDATITFQES